MRKAMLMTGIMFALAMTAGCGNQTQETKSTMEVQTEENAAETQKQETEETKSEEIENTVSDQTETDTQTTETEETPSVDQTDNQPASGSDILVAYFSWSGNTKQIAEMISEKTGGDLFEIVPATPYTEDYDAVVDQAQKEQEENARPEIADTVEDWDSYQTVFIGYPNWWSDVPMIINTFMESYDFSGKTVVPFCTHGGGGFGGSLSSIENGVQGASVLEGFSVSGSSVDSAEEDVQTWIDSLDIQ